MREWNHPSQYDKNGKTIPDAYWDNIPTIATDLMKDESVRDLLLEKKDQTAWEEEFNLQGQGKFLAIDNGPVFYLNSDSPAKMEGGISLEGFLKASVSPKRGNIISVKKQADKSKFKRPSKKRKTEKIRYDHARTHMIYACRKYKEAGWPLGWSVWSGLTVDQIAKEHGYNTWEEHQQNIARQREAEAAEITAKEKTEKEEMDELIKEEKDIAPFIERIKEKLTKEGSNQINEADFIRREAERLRKKEQQKENVVSDEEPKQKVEIRPTETGFTIEGLSDNVQILDMRRRSDNNYYFVNLIIDGSQTSRTLKTKDEKLAETRFNDLKRQYIWNIIAQDRYEPANANPEPNPEPIMETIKITEPNASFLDRMKKTIKEFIFKEDKQTEVLPQNEELDETVWIEPNEPAPEPMKVKSYLVKDHNNVLVKAAGSVLIIEATMEERAKAQAWDVLESKGKYRLDELTERDRMMIEYGNENE